MITFKRFQTYSLMLSLCAMNYYQRTCQGGLFDNNSISGYLIIIQFLG